MNLSDTTLITDTFKCPTFAYNNAMLSYRACIGRQIAKEAINGGFLYPECAVCVDGIEVSKHFGYKPVLGKPKSFGTRIIKKRKKKGESPYSGHFIGSDCKNSQMSCGSPAVTQSGRNIGPKRGRVSESESLLLLKAQVTYILKLIREGKVMEATRRIKLLSKELEA